MFGICIAVVDNIGVDGQIDVDVDVDTVGDVGVGVDDHAAVCVGVYS